MQHPPRPNPPLDYRPHSEDAKARRWPLWVGLAVVAVVVAAALLLLMHRASPVTPVPRPYSLPATQPAWPVAPSVTRPTTDQ